MTNPRTNSWVHSKCLEQFTTRKVFRQSKKSDEIPDWPGEAVFDQSVATRPVETSIADADAGTAYSTFPPLHAVDPAGKEYAASLPRRMWLTTTASPLPSIIRWLSPQPICPIEIVEPQPVEAEYFAE